MCRTNLLLNGPIVDMRTAKELDFADRERKRLLYSVGAKPHVATFPVFRLCGPLPPCMCISSDKYPFSINSHTLGFGRRHFG